MDQDDSTAPSADERGKKLVGMRIVKRPAPVESLKHSTRNRFDEFELVMTYQETGNG